MRLVYLESPYAGTAVEVAFHVQYARACMLHCFMIGDAPFVSHLLYTQALDDNDPADRRLGIEAGFDWARVADVTVVYTDLGISPGMAEGIERAEAAGRPIEYRSIGWSR